MKIISFSSIKNLIQWINHKLNHKIEHFTKKNLKETLIKGGIPLLIIIIIWEIIEDIIFPIFFGYLGYYFHSIFYTLIPVSWLLCLHWLVVPFFWGLWLKYSQPLSMSFLKFTNKLNKRK